MGQKTKRIVNAFVIGFVGTLLLQVLDHYADFTKALNDGNWAWLRSVGTAVVGAALLAGLRAIQSYVVQVPSPEPDESAP